MRPHVGAGVLLPVPQNPGKPRAGPVRARLSMTPGSQRQGQREPPEETEGGRGMASAFKNQKAETRGTCTEAGHRQDIEQAVLTRHELTEHHSGPGTPNPKFPSRFSPEPDPPVLLNTSEPDAAGGALASLRCPSPFPNPASCPSLGRVSLDPLHHPAPRLHLVSHTDHYVQEDPPWWTHMLELWFS